MRRRAREMVRRGSGGRRRGEFFGKVKDSRKEG